MRNVLYINDQILPIDATDTEQIIQTVVSLCDCGMNVTLHLPTPTNKKAVSIRELETYYQVKLTCSLQQTKLRGTRFRCLTKCLYPLKVCFAVRNKKNPIIHTRNLPTVFVFLIFSDIPVLYETYRPWQQQFRILKPLLGWMAKHSQLLGIITHSNYTRSIFIQNGYTENQVKAILNGYDPRRMLPGYSKTEARKILGINSEHTTAVYTGHISMSKGCGILLQMAEQSPDIHFFLVGSTGRGEIEQKAEKMVNVHIVNWLPFSKILPYLAMADVLVIPPSNTPLKAGRTVLPIKSFLYMAMGRPILAPRSPDTEEIFRHGENSFLVEPDRPELAVKALRQITQTPQLAEKLAVTAQKDGSAYSYSARGEKILLFIQERLQKKGL